MTDEHVMAVVCHGGDVEPPTLPRPMLQSFPLRIPLLKVIMCVCVCVSECV